MISFLSIKLARKYRSRCFFFGSFDSYVRGVIKLLKATCYRTNQFSDSRRINFVTLFRLAIHWVWHWQWRDRANQCKNFARSCGRHRARIVSRSWTMLCKSVPKRRTWTRTYRSVISLCSSEDFLCNCNATLTPRIVITKARVELSP